jgi:membrane associated rhomboid family serine protease
VSDHGTSAQPWPTGTPPTCYRHTGRESYITCQRCGRTICPECQTRASVGVHCPECVREANASRPQARTIFGGAVPTGDGALVTKAIIGLCVGMYLISTYVETGLQLDLAMIGYAVSRGQLVGIADGEYWRLLTPVLLHAGTLHLFVNMLSLWFLGPFLERALGRARFATLFVVGAMGGSALSFAFNAPNIQGVGASGAVFALVGALIPIYRRLNLEIGPVLAMIAINAVFGFVVSGIDWRAHLGGLITGLALGLAFAYAPRERRALLHGAAVVAVLIAIAVAVVARTSQLTG